MQPMSGKKMINNNYMTVVCHVYDLNVLYVNSFEITKFAGYLSIIYGGIAVHRGNVNNYLVRDIDYSD